MVGIFKACANWNSVFFFLISGETLASVVKYESKAAFRILTEEVVNDDLRAGERKQRPGRQDPDCRA